MFKKLLLSLIKKLNRQLYPNLQKNLETMMVLNAKVNVDLVKEKSDVSSLEDVEFKVFSQWGEDGIIQYLINSIDVPEKSKKFIEFGVEDYSEANTKFLLINNNWDGLIIDGDPQLSKKISGSGILWKYGLKAVSQFITKDNINDIFKSQGFTGEIGLLSVDIDGNDYWVWDSIKCIDPIIVVAEFNSVFGFEKSVTIPYDETFFRTEAHYSNLYFGASLQALKDLAEAKGYDFVGTNSAGNNAFFVRKDKMSDFLKGLDGKTYISKFRESRNKNNKLSYLTGDDKLKEIKHLPVLDLFTGKEVLISELFDL